MDFGIGKKGSESGPPTERPEDTSSRLQRLVGGVEGLRSWSGEPTEYEASSVEDFEAIRLPELKELSPELQKIVDATQGTAIVHTAVPFGRVVRTNATPEGRAISQGGFMRFGDGYQNEYVHRSSWPHDLAQLPLDQSHPDLGEAVAILPEIKIPTLEIKDPGKRGFLGRFGKNEIIPTASTTEPSPVMIENPYTHAQEEAMYVDYAFDPSMASGELHSLRAEYRVKEFSLHRGGQQLHLSTRLPRSLALNFCKLIIEEPQAARDFAENVVLTHAGLPIDVWHDPEVPVRPPYEEVPDSWNIHLVTLDAAKGYIVQPLGR